MQNKTKWHGLFAGIAHKNIYKLLHSVEKMIEAIVKNLRSKKISRTKKQSKKKESAHIKSPNF